MAKPTGKIKLNGLHDPRTAQAAGGQRPSSAPAQAKTAEKSPSKTKSRLSIFPGGPMLWLLIGLAVGLGGWLGGRTYLRRILAERLTSAQSEQAAIESIDALLRLDANATVEVSQGLGHPEFMVANAAFRALGGQLEAWSKLEPADRLVRMQQVVAQLEIIPSDVDQDHRILISGLASRIYADALSNREPGAARLLEACRRVIAKSDPAAVGARLARLEQPSGGPDLAREEEVDNPVPPPLPPLNPASSPRDMGPQALPDTANGQAPELEPSRSSSATSVSRMPRMSISSESPQPTNSKPTMHLTASTQSIGGTQSISDTQADTRRPESNQGLLELAREPVLADDSSSRTRIIPQNVVPLSREPSAEELTRQEEVTIAGMDELKIDQLVRLLSSLQPRISQAAALALRQKGMPEESLTLAVELATGSAEQRNGLLDELVTRDNLDPRPWLLWMATDGQDEVRLHAVGLLKPLADQDVRRQLRLLLNKERDEQIAGVIRNVLSQ